jgi:hypothetical protein
MSSNSWLIGMETFSLSTSQLFDGTDRAQALPHFRGQILFDLIGNQTRFVQVFEVRLIFQTAPDGTTPAMRPIRARSFALTGSSCSLLR